jgi:hypothetical protein
MDTEQSNPHMRKHVRSVNLPWLHNDIVGMKWSFIDFSSSISCEPGCGGRVS